MRIKTLAELLTLSTNIYMLSKDEEFINGLSEMIRKGKSKLNELTEDISGENDESEEHLVQRLAQKAREAKAHVEQKMEEVAKKVYEKMQIAHSDEVKVLNEKLESLKRELALAEARVLHLEQATGLVNEKRS